MSDTFWTAFFTALPGTLTALGAVWAVLHQTKKSKDRSLTTNDKLDHITDLTNSTLTAANKRIEELENQVTKLIVEREDKFPTILPSSMVD